MFLYYRDPYATTLMATVVAIRREKGKNYIQLDQTVFYPEGGGQPGDRGFIDQVKVIDTQLSANGEVLHQIEGEGNFVEGQEVTLTLDWDHRYDFMQQHSAQHLLSGTLYTLFNIGTVSVHLGNTEISIELDTDAISEEQIVATEEAVNRVIRQNVPISAQTVKQEEIPPLNLRRSVKVEGDVRLITIEGYDLIACGGLHVKESSELGYIYYLRSERIRGHLRTFWIAGKRATDAIRRNNAIVDRVGTLLSAPPQGIVEGIANLQKEVTQKQYEGQQHALKVASLLFDKLLGKGETLKGVPLVIFDASDWEEPYLKQLPELFLKETALALAYVAERPDGKVGWLLCLKGVEEEVELFKSLKEEALPLIEGKGGGRPPMWQGIGDKQGGKGEFLERVESLIRGHLGG